ncbi:MAG TPA: FAD binding domain-containing protein [bacterium]|nr:FAD binding domain-containing protein [bacterium]
MKIKDFVIPAKISEAYEFAHSLGQSAYYIAGGTSAYFVQANVEKIAIDISKLPLFGITAKRDSFRIGSLTTISDIMKKEEDGFVLNRAAKRFVNQQIRNISTIGGNIARVFYWSDFPVVLKTLDGRIKITGFDSKTLKISDVFHNSTTHKEAIGNAIIEYIEIPRLLKNMGFSYSKETRISSGFSSATIASFIELKDNKIKDVRITVGSVFIFPMRLFELENSLKGEPADLSIINKINFNLLDKYKFIPRDGMNLEYCKHLVKTRIKDVLVEAFKEALGER